MAGNTTSTTGISFKTTAASVFDPSVIAKLDQAATDKSWTAIRFHNGKKVYQRGDLIDPTRIDSKGRTNLQRMRKGLAPVGPDDQPIVLHHLTQMDDSPIAEVGDTLHMRNQGVLNTNPHTTPSGIDRRHFDKWRRNYWRRRARDFQ